jgi:acyl transferase domain-containing protein
MSGGHSYGELVALSAAGAFDARALLELSTARADAILAAAGGDPGTMAAVTGTAQEVRQALAGHEVTLANLNAPSQVVISGATTAVESALEALEAHGLPAQRLRVACAFHSPVVAGGGEIFARSLAGTPVSAPRLPVWSNRTAVPYPAEPELIRQELAAQIGSAVRFSDQVTAMYAAGARVFVEAGPGRVLTGLVEATLGELPHLALACDGPAGQGLRAFLITVAQLACAGVAVDLSFLFEGRADPDRPARTRRLWSVTGHLVRDPAGGYLPGATVPARMIKEFPVSAPKTREEMLAEYLRASREMVAAQRDVMMSFLGTAAPAPAAAVPAPVYAAAQAQAAALPTSQHGTEPPAPAGQRQGGQLPGQAAPEQHSGGEREDIAATLLGLISERTGYPVDLLEPGLDLEADLSIDSIKRTAIATEMAKRIGLRVTSGDEAIRELVRARTVEAMTQWLERKAAEVAAGPGAGQAQRLIPRLDAAPARTVPPSRLDGASFAITGTSPVAGLLARRLREHGAHAETVTLEDAAATDAGGLVLLDGLGDSAVPLPPAMYPLIRQHLLSVEKGGILAAGSPDSPEAAGLSGLFRTIALEFPHHQVRFADIGDTTGTEALAGLLLDELLDESPEPVVIYSGGVRHRLRLAHEPLAGRGTPAQALGLTGESVIVMIGGARGITAWFTGEIARAAAPAIELVGRTALPAEPESQDIAGAPDAAAIRAVLARRGMRSPAGIERETREILARREVASTMSELRELGARARYHCADATDEAAISQVLKQVHAEHGRIDGLVIAAGIIEDRLIADKEPESFSRVFATKVNGAKTVLAALGELDCVPGFVVLYGSIAATFGSRGQCDYAAANDALESVGAAWARRTGGRCLTVHWGPWAPAGTHAGMVTADLAAQFGERGIELIDPPHGAQSLLRELAWGDRALTCVVYTAPVSMAPESRAGNAG